MYLLLCVENYCRKEMHNFIKKPRCSAFPVFNYAVLGSCSLIYALCDSWRWMYKSSECIVYVMLFLLTSVDLIGVRRNKTAIVAVTVSREMFSFFLFCNCNYKCTNININKKHS